MATTTKKKTTARKTPAKSAKNEPVKKPFRREVGAVIFFFLTLFSFLGYFNIDALFINFFCKNVLKGILGYGYYIMPPAFLLCALFLMFHRGRPVVSRVICTLLLPIIFGAFLHLAASDVDAGFGEGFSNLIKTLYSSGKEMTGGGAFCGLLAIAFAAMFSIYGAVPIFAVCFIILIFPVFKISPTRIIQKINARERIEYEQIPIAEKQPVIKQSAVGKAKQRKSGIDIPLDDAIDPDEYVEHKVGFFNTAPRVKTPDEVAAKHSPTSSVEPVSFEEAANIAGVSPNYSETVKKEDEEEQISSETVVSDKLPEKPKKPEKAITFEEVTHEAEEISQLIENEDTADKPMYAYPPSSLLAAGSGTAVDSREEISVNKERLQSTLDSFGVNANIVDITRGPTVTRYDLELEAGVKLTKLTNLADDLALSLGVTGVRIAPIPDKISTVGVEVPNKNVSMVYLRDIIESKSFDGAASKLSFAVGKDIGGNSIVGNIAKLPHMLIAGTTGSGKSVCMNSIILSLLFKATPDEVRLIMIDPKMVELGIYNGIPHLYIPVVTDPKKAAGALQWTVIEMLKRYRLFSEAEVRDLAGYNKIQRENGEDILPQVVIVIDELADLMLVASKEVEDSICRVAQMGRASGMHLIIATQRPSADVITGLMKANIPSRIAFSVSSALESRIILDSQGAEKLVGNGDMLYSPIGSGKPKRIQGAFVSDDEREKVINFIKANSESQYSEDIQVQIDMVTESKTAASGGKEQAKEADAASDYDAMLPQAVEIIFDSKQASVSMLQRRLKLGYSRAARIVDQMEELGILGPFEGSKPRQILITKEQWEQMQNPDALPVQSTLDDYDLSEAEDNDE